jgi:predicted RNase H-like nuclease
MNFIGIDLGWMKNGDTALILLDSRGRVRDHGYVRGDKEIASFVENHSQGGCLVGVDAPLVVKNALGQRRCEKGLHSIGIPVYPANRRWLMKSFQGVRGESLVVELQKKGFSLIDGPPSSEKIQGIIEVYPYATLKMLLRRVPPYKKGGKTERSAGTIKLLSMLENLEPPISLPRELLDLRDATMKSLKKTSDYVDAAVAAYTVYMYHCTPSKCLILGDKKEGFVLLPKRS